MNTDEHRFRASGPAWLPGLAALAALAAAGACRSSTTSAPARGADAAATVVDVAAAPPIVEAGPPEAVTEAEPIAVLEPPEDKVPAGVDPWLAFADTPVTVADAGGTRVASEGDAVLPGSLLTLESWGQAELDLPDGSALKLEELLELFLRAVVVRDGLRQVELTVFDGNVRAIVAASSEAGSVFRVATPVGVVEAQAADFAVEVDGGTGATRVLVLGGSVLVQSGAEQRELAGAGSLPRALEVPAPGVLNDVDVAPAWLSRWAAWDERQADRFLNAYGIDVAKPDEIDSTAFSAEAHPLWAAQIRQRRANIAGRAKALSDALASDGRPVPDDPRARLAAARDVWGGTTRNPNVSALEALRAGRADQWTARAGTRAERLRALGEAMTQLRQAYLDSPPAP